VRSGLAGAGRAGSVARRIRGRAGLSRSQLLPSGGWPCGLRGSRGWVTAGTGGSSH